MLVGDSTVKVWNVTFGGAHDARGVFYNRGTILPIEEGILLTTGTAISVEGPNKSRSLTGKNNMKGDQDIHFIAQLRTYDASWISFEFEAVDEVITFNYVFASEEYPEYVGSPFNDAFGFLLTDLETGDMQNLAVIPGDNLPITVNNINHKKHSNLYIKNSVSGKNTIEYDGLTATLIAYSEVIPKRKYRIKIAIADVMDQAYDSGVFLEGKSFRSQNKKQFYTQNSGYFEAVKNDQLEWVSPAYAAMKSLEGNVETEEEKVEIPSELKIDSVVVYFDYDQFIPISNSLDKALKKINTLNAQECTAKIIGHTDQQGNSPYNVELSKKRAMYMKKWMEDQFDIQVVSVEYKSFNQLVNSQESEESFAQNRRVVILFETKIR